MTVVDKSQYLYPPRKYLLLRLTLRRGCEGYFSEPRRLQTCSGSYMFETDLMILEQMGTLQNGNYPKALDPIRIDLWH